MPRNFAIRLSCSYGDADAWVTLADRDESVEQILKRSWEFKCHKHGAQRAMPKEVIEVAPLEDLRRSQSSQGDLPAVPVADPAASRNRIPPSSQRELIFVPLVLYRCTHHCH